MSKLQEYLLMEIVRCVLLSFMGWLVLRLGRLPNFVIQGKETVLKLSEGIIRLPTEWSEYLLLSFEGKSCSSFSQSSIRQSLVGTRPSNKEILWSLSRPRKLQTMAETPTGRYLLAQLCSWVLPYFWLLNLGRSKHGKWAMQETVKQSLVGTSGCLKDDGGVDACIRAEQLCVGYLFLSSCFLFRYEGGLSKTWAWEECQPSSLACNALAQVSQPYSVISCPAWNLFLHAAEASLLRTIS